MFLPNLLIFIFMQAQVMDTMALRLIEYDVNPSFLLTGADPITLYQTSSSYLFSSQYSLWKDKIIALASQVKAALDPIRGVTMTNYERLAAGVSVSRYANGKSLYVNHTSSDYQNGSLVVPKEGYLVAWANGMAVSIPFGRITPSN